MGVKVKASMASSSRPVPATTPKRRDPGSLRPKSSKTLRLEAVPEANAPWSMVSSYMSVSSEVEAADTSMEATGEAAGDSAVGT